MRVRGSIGGLRIQEKVLICESIAVMRGLCISRCCYRRLRHGSSSLVGVHLATAVVILVRNVPYEKLLLLTITTPDKATTSLPSRGSSCHAIRPHSLVWFE